MGVESLAPRTVRCLLDARPVCSKSPLNSEHIREVKKYGAFIASTIHQFDHLDRGMDRAREIIDDYEKDSRSFPGGMVIMARSMAKSVGRFGRDWHAPNGGLWLTLVMVNTMIPAISRLIPLAAGVACCEFIRDYNINARLKWVNDVLVRGKKIAGILTETHRGKKSGEEYILIGLGVNVNNDRFPPELAGEALAMRSELGRELDLTRGAHELLAALAWNMGLLFFDEKNLLAARGESRQPQSLLLQRWRQLSDTLGRRVKFGFNVRETPQYEATVIGIDQAGGVQLELIDGSHITEYGGEIIYIE